MLTQPQIGSGQACKAWSLVGSMTRTVDYLQLTIEHDESRRQALLQPFVSLAPPHDWTEAEERRRVFWNVFALDRFCSAAMGWNTSLTADEVHRRLPCDGMLWRKEKPVATPLFGIWDKSSARIGIPISFVAATEDAAEGPSQTAAAESSHLPGAFGADNDIATVGAYAYCIEATESLSRVTSHFLQQRIDWRDARDVGLWLTRFKELDLRLVHWKMLLPHKWKADSYRAGNSSGPLVMDPNLTLAHVTHNTSMILLHQPIAFPPPALLGPYQARLPSACSIETCLAAATEITIITTKYLESTAAGQPVAHQYVFCVYIAARVLLVSWRHQRYTEMPLELPGEFWTLVDALGEFSARWHGRGRGRGQGQGHDGGAMPLDLAAKYADKLRELHACCLQNAQFHVNLAAYTTELDQSGTRAVQHPSSSHHDASSEAQAQPSHYYAAVNWGAYNAPSEMTNPLPARAQHQHGGVPLQPIVLSATSGGPGLLPQGTVPEALGHSPQDSLGSIPQTLLDQQFGEMDRIISFEDGTMFATTMDCTGGGDEAWLLSADMNGMEGTMP